jgi:transposase
VLLEASTESEWVARHLEALGHAVIVADPGFAPMYAARSKRIKTDKRDARALCEALQGGTYRATHRASDAQRHVRADLAVRDALVRTRTRYVAIIKACVVTGSRLPSGEPERNATKLAQLELAETTRAELAPLVALLAPLNSEIDAADRRLTTYAAQSGVVRRLRTVPGVGPVTALAFVSALDDVAVRECAPGASVSRPGAERAELRGSASTGVGSRNGATRERGGCWSKRRGECCGHASSRRHRSKHGRSRWPAGAVNASQWSHSLAA